ncbi:MAG TPA: polymer-forming cytoskeletal protein [Myxococcota bacterium]|jgi:cytoskeletal protein CcmA (bactofilin family)|nr:polymer-forming cytoskeletal protein [Myxococcota bacterium]
MAFKTRRDDTGGGPIQVDGQIIALLGRGSRFEGRLVFEGTVQINGDFKGEILSEDTLIIGEGAQVEATIEVGAVVITGTVTGTVRARRAIEIHRPGRMKGDLYTPSLTIEPGVVFEGSCRMEALEAVFERDRANGGTATVTPAPAPALPPVALPKT